MAWGPEFAVHSVAWVDYGMWIMGCFPIEERKRGSTNKKKLKGNES